MTAAKSKRLHLDSRHLAIAILPAAVLVLSDILLNRYGWPLESQTRFSGEMNAHLEAEARFRLLAAFLIFIAAAISALVYFGRVLRLLDKGSLLRLGVATVTLVLSVALYFESLSPQQTQEFTDQRVYCAAASSPGKIKLHDGAAVDERRPGRSPAYLPDNCAAERFASLRELIFIERLLLIFAIPAVVFGAITALARRPAAAQAEPPGAASAASGHSAADPAAAGGELLKSSQADGFGTERAIERPGMAAHQLNTVLYLSAFLLVGGLLFLSAFLHMGNHIVDAAASPAYRSRTQALVLFYGVSYSILIASFYIPVATRLADGRPTTPPVPAGEGEAGAEASEPLALDQLLRIAAAIFSPLIVALLGEVISLPI